jgi:hypothetical protein
MPAPRVREHTVTGASGAVMALVGIVVLLAGIALLVTGISLAASGHHGIGVPLIPIGAVVLWVGLFLPTGLTAVIPGQARVVQLFGRYVGTVRQPGLRWFNPFTRRRRVSTRIRNHETAITKVNDADGNPIEIAAVLVWQVEDTARALYEVDDFVEFVNIQAETAVRHIATSYSYDSHGEGTLSLRDNAGEITEKLSAEIAERVESAGVHIVESRLTRLAYAPEIAQAMLVRQQAEALVGARKVIVHGAVEIACDALDELEKKGVSIGEDRKAKLIGNLLTVICGDAKVQPTFAINDEHA